jgi:pyridoxal phosphate enzyme (YggS family)
MGVNSEKYLEIKKELGDRVSLVAVSKLKTVEEIKALYDLGQRDFGENYVQELMDKQKRLPTDIRWHFIGHLQTNKVKYIAGSVHTIQSLDSINLLKEINKQANKSAHVVEVLLQVHIAEEETKYGLDEQELNSILNRSNDFLNIKIRGMMGMASFSEDLQKVKQEFKYLKWLFDKYKSQGIPGVDFSILSMGMSGDYQLAVEEGSNMVRIGSLLFGHRAK